MLLYSYLVVNEWYNRLYVITIIRFNINHFIAT